MRERGQTAFREPDEAERVLGDQSKGDLAVVGGGGGLQTNSSHGALDLLDVGARAPCGRQVGKTKPGRFRNQRVSVSPKTRKAKMRR